MDNWHNFDGTWVNLNLVKEIWVNPDVYNKGIYKIYYLAFDDKCGNALFKQNFPSREEAQEYLDETMNLLKHSPTVQSVHP